MKRKIILLLATAVLLSVIAISWCNHIIVQASEKYLYNTTDKIPRCKAALLLGTSKNLSNGKINAYFQNRIDATVDLYHSGVISKIVISGDNSRVGYDEPTDMKNELVKNGVDSNSIILDYAGFRTFDSMYRLKEIFGQDTAIVISQKFHNERAIYIAQHLDMVTYGYNAKDVNKYYGFKTNIREKFARVKMMLDFVTGIKPKFLGEKIKI